MAQSNQELSLKLEKAGAQLKPSSFGAVMKEWYGKASHSLSALCGSEVEARKLYVAAITHITRSADLMQCAPQSLQNCIMLSATTKLYPGPYQECAYIKYGNEAQFQPQYQGLIKLAIRGKVAKDIKGVVVYSKDEFVWEEGTNAKLIHKPYRDGPDRGERIAVYAVAKLSDNETTFRVLLPSQIESIKKRSRAANSKFSPWNSDDEDSMWIKSAIKNLCKFLPKGTEAQELVEAIEIDNSQERPDLAKPQILDVEVEPVSEPPSQASA